MNSKVFYSWQSDLPNSTNRGFILKALENATKAIRDDNSIEVEPVVDRDTVGIPGSPDIGNTIFEKIEQADVFVCDVSIINKDAVFITVQNENVNINEQKSPRLTPNPNVLLELGYAWRGLGPSRVIMVINTAFGKVELLPFDLRNKRVLAYSMPEETDDRATERRKLEAVLEIGLRVIFEGLQKQMPGEVVKPVSIGEQTREAIENTKPNQVSLVKKYMNWLANEFEALAPDFTDPKGDELDDLFVHAVDETQALVVDFSRLAQTIAEMNAAEVAEAVYKGFALILDHYNIAHGYSGAYRKFDFDFYKFLGHELFVTFFSFLIRESRWELIGNLLDEDIYITNDRQHYSKTVPFDYVSEHLDILEYRNRRLKSNRASIHADILNSRHTQGELGKLVPIEQFINADYFLFLRAELQETEVETHLMSWRAWSTLYMNHQPPRFIEEAASVKAATRLLRPLGVSDIATLRSRLSERAGKLEKLFNSRALLIWDHPLKYFDVAKIGSR